MKNIYSKKLSETLQKSIADSKVVESECLPQKKTFFVRPSEDKLDMCFQPQNPAHNYVHTFFHTRCRILMRSSLDVLSAGNAFYTQKQ